MTKGEKTVQCWRSTELRLSFNASRDKGVFLSAVIMALRVVNASLRERRRRPSNKALRIQK